MRWQLGGSVLGAAAALAASTVLAQGTTVPLATTNDSGASGQAMVEVTGSGSSIMLMVSGLEPNSRHAAHIHNGACSGGISYPLEVVVADDSGAGTSTTALSAAPDATWWIQVHRAESPPGPGIVCGQAMP